VVLFRTTTTDHIPPLTPHLVNRKLGYGLDGPGFEARLGWHVPSPKRPDPLWGPPCGYQVIFAGASGRGAMLTTPSSAETKNEWS